MIQGEKPRRGVLINFIQKGLVYTEIETHIKPDGGEVNCRVPFSITQEHVCKVSSSPPLLPPVVRSLTRLCVVQEERSAPTANAASGGGAATAAGAAPVVASDGVYQVLDVDVSKLVSHNGEVFACQWNPKHPNVLATGASDATAVLWTIPRGKSCAAAGKVPSAVVAVTVFVGEDC